MSASKHLHPELFHGTHADLSVGDTVEPRTEWTPGEGRAFATSDYKNALWYAGNRAHTQGKLFGTVYNVEPIDPNDISDVNKLVDFGVPTYTSKKGLKVKGIAGFIPADERPDV